MALIQCEECGHTVSDSARACPKCGCPIAAVNKTPRRVPEGKPKNNKLWLWFAAAVAALCLIGGGVYAFTKAGPKTKVQYRQTTEIDDNGTHTTIKNVDNSVTDNEMQSEPQKLQVTKVEYAHCLAPQAGNTYYGMNMCDGNLTTAWAVKLSNDAIWGGEGNLYGPTFWVKGKKLSYIIIRNGYCKNNKSFNNNTRASWISFNILNADGSSRDYCDMDLNDTQSSQRINFSRDLDPNNITKIQMTFTEGCFYHGAKWDDLCISEVEFWGYE